MKVFYYYFLFYMIISPCSSQEIERDEDLKAKAEQLNNYSHELLGISLSSLSILINASADDYIPLWYLEETGLINNLKHLEEHGYIQIEIVDELPDKSIQGRFVRILLTERGSIISNSLLQ